MKKGKLYLIPTFIGDGKYNIELPEFIKQIVVLIDIFIVENDKTARAFLKPLLFNPIQETDIRMIDKHSGDHLSKSILKECLNNRNVAILSEAGLPCIADPGSKLVLEAHRLDIEVVPLVGPSSIFLALMGSGLNGQEFSFNGYLPVDKNERAKKIKVYENISLKNGSTQIFIETPYRNNNLLKDLISSCNDTTILSISIGLLTERQMIKTHSISEWRTKNTDLEKTPAIFMINAQL